MAADNFTLKDSGAREEFASGAKRESQGDRPNTAARRLAHEAQNRTRIDARGQKNANLDVGQQMRTHALSDGLPHADLYFRWIHPFERGFSEHGRDRVVGFRFANPLTIDPLGVARG